MASSRSSTGPDATAFPDPEELVRYSLEPGGTPYTIRTVRPADLEAVASIHHQHLGTGTLDLERREPRYFAELVARYQQEGRQALFVTAGPEGVLGWGVVKRYSDREGYAGAAETSVFLDRAHLGRGHGPRMKRILLDHCRAYGYHHVVARILAANETSIRYNERLGYRRVGIQHGIGEVDGKRLDVCILELLLE